ncbi:MAG: Tyrosine-tRNA ligase [Parcubacteria group bacterium GW2011_GWA2_49_9]|nr:MAG: Tyrosine-tRNA ligase [Parcubacteria group bacterium GW2011_GWA2_49_9]
MSFFAKTPQITSDGANIKELLTRGVERVYPSAEFLEKKLKSGEQQTIYLGIDPTGPSLHLGHIIPILKLRQFQELGHKVILLIGDFTGMIGDPTDKAATRKKLTHEEVLENAKLYKTQASKMLSFSGGNPAELKYNSTWLEKLSFADVLELSSHLTHADMVKRDMFQKRIAEGKELYMHEFLYPLMQGYDSVAMDVDGEVGGNDQTFNMLVGRDLLKKLKGKEKFVISMKLLADPSGKKMGKTEGNMVSFLDTPADCFGKIMSWPDGAIVPAAESCTLLSEEEIGAMKKRLESGGNPKEEKMKLAEAVVSLLHGGDEATKARASFDAAFTEGKPVDFVEISREGNPMGTLIEKGIVASKTELRRLIAAGAVTCLDSDTKVGEDFALSFPAGKYRIGKHRFIEFR